MLFSSASFERAMASISGVISTASISASGQRRTSSAVKSPVPHARSNILHSSGIDMSLIDERRHAISNPRDMTLFMQSYLAAMLAKSRIIGLSLLCFSSVIFLCADYIIRGGRGFAYFQRFLDGLSFRPRRVDFAFTNFRLKNPCKTGAFRRW